MAALQPSRHKLQGLIASAGFESGDAIVAGLWVRGPLGPMNDVMWIRPNGERVLIAPTQHIADFVQAIYDFDRIEIAPVVVSGTTNELIIDAQMIRMQMQLRRIIVPLPLPRRRPLWFTRRIESPIARVLMGVSTHGTTSRGLHEWYQAKAVRPVSSATATAEGKSCGACVPIERELRVGFSNPPKFASVVSVSPTLVDPSANLDRLLST